MILSPRRNSKRHRRTKMMGLSCNTSARYTRIRRGRSTCTYYCVGFFAVVVAILFLGIDVVDSSTDATTASSQQQPHESSPYYRPAAPRIATASELYVIVSHPDNALSQVVAQQLQPAKVYWIILLCETNENMHKLQRKINKFNKQNLLCQCSCLDVYDKSPQQLRQAAIKCWKDVEHFATASSHSGDDNKHPLRLCGVLFNQYGYSSDDDGTKDVGNDASSSTSISPLAQYKLLSTAVLIDTLQTMAAAAKKQQPRRYPEYDDKLSILVVGTEAARGLPKMKFPIPNIDCTEQSIQNILQGNSSSSWEREYSELNALVVLYIKALAAKATQRQWYYAIVSPGMTQESLQVKHVPPHARTIYFRMKMILCRYVLFFLLQKLEIAKTTQQGGALLARALLGNARYPSGSFVGAKSGTGGPLCEQTELEGGKFLDDMKLQRLVYKVVQEAIQ